jgi:hypothetical protein
MKYISAILFRLPVFIRVAVVKESNVFIETCPS